METKLWRSADLSKLAHVEPPFSFEAIQSLVQLCTWEDQGWQTYFRQNAIKPRTVVYEDLLDYGRRCSDGLSAIWPYSRAARCFANRVTAPAPIRRNLRRVGQKATRRAHTTANRQSLFDPPLADQ
jgi:Stf0 sulfotransferase